FEQDRNLAGISVKGEASNVKYHSSGHIYFTLKDAGSALSCVMFAGNRTAGLKFRLEEGQSIICSGSISVYEKTGTYQLYARKIERDGIGLLYEKYELLKTELEERGYFAKEREKPIPKFPKRVGIVTASTGAAIQDICNISARRDPYVQLILYPAKVQGEGAAATIVSGIKRLDAMGLDTIIIGRGGGSIEDLWAFNEECVAEAVYEAKTPIISAVGHETDFTIADFVSDLRAPTPSAAAELAVPDIKSILERLDSYAEDFSESLHGRIRLLKSITETYRQKILKASPLAKVAAQKEALVSIREKLGFYMLDRVKSSKNTVEGYRSRLGFEMKTRLMSEKTKLSVYAEKLSGASPLKKIASGYAYVENEKGVAITGIEDVTAGDSLKVNVSDGVIFTTVTKKEEEQWLKKKK
ncbi:MAG: exodeoxyribonuclease VII large subunit, partial [Lachnospiraceae bacterium]|nr:exodeoxyribonuclease VII large subunit [Lachnospiraceae bacterium]